MITNAKYYNYYETPRGYDNLIMYSDGEYLLALLFEKEKKENVYIKKELPIFKCTKEWLDIYFSGKNPLFTPKYLLENSTTFRKEVIEILKKIPYGKTSTYGEIAKEIASIHNINKMSSQAVGNAVHYNPICIIIPCHRVIGSDNSIVGYGGGIDNKIKLLEHEKTN